MEPLEYIRGFTEFLGCKIDLSKKPLIPRVETEFWVEKAIKDIVTSDKLAFFGRYHKFNNCEVCGIKVLDMFAGSGCIGIAVLKHIKNAHVTFADKQKNCIEQIKINLSRNIHDCELYVKNFTVIKSDIFENIKGEYDFIFANPPYIPIKNKNKIQESVLNYEPKQALFGGADGLFYIRKFLRDAKNHLNKNGRIFMEFSPEQKGDIEKLLKKYNYQSWQFHKDQYARYRWLVAIL